MERLRGLAGVYSAPPDIACRLAFCRGEGLRRGGRKGQASSETMVRSRGLEPPRDFSHKHLKLARLPVPPRPHGAGRRPLGLRSGGPGNTKSALTAQGRHPPAMDSVEWRISDGLVPYPEAVETMESGVA